MTIYLIAYCMVSALLQFILGWAWHSHDAVHRAIKYLFLFLCVWGFFFGAYLICVKGGLV
jgi:hypothetical protein